MKCLRPTSWALGLLLLTVIGGIAVNAAPQSRPASEEGVAAGRVAQASAMSVVSINPTLTAWDDTIETVGAIAPWQEAVINAQIGGYQIVELRVDVGDTVKKGQVLAVLNQAMLQAQRAELLARADRALANRKRATTLNGQGNLSAKSLLEAETDEKTARALLQINSLEIAYATVVAPDDGIVVSRTAMLGQVSQLGTEMFRIIRQGRLEWQAELAAPDLSRVRAGQKVVIDLPNGDVAAGIVRQLPPVLDEATRRGLVYAELVGNNSALTGMYSKGRIYLGRREALSVPAESLLVKDGRYYVAQLSMEVVEATASPATASLATVSLAPVVIGSYAGNQVEITGGLSPADRIVLQGGGLLDDGDRVRVVPRAAAE